MVGRELNCSWKPFLLIAATVIPASYSHVRYTNIKVAALSAVHTCPKNGGGCNCAPPCGQGPLPAGIPNVITGFNATYNVSHLAFVKVTLEGRNIREYPDGSFQPGSFNGTHFYVYNRTVDGIPVEGSTHES